MKVLPLFVLSALILTGCGGSGGGSDSSGTTSTGTGNSGSAINTGNNTGSNSGSTDSGSTDSGSTGGNTGTTTPDNGNNTGGTTEPTTPPDSTEFADLMLYAVNQARSQQQNCGGEIMPAVPALTWDYDLEAAAYGHSSDMANGNFMSHTGSDGSSAGDRIDATGYVSSAWAENVAAGQKDIDAVMASWMASPGHCKNIMSGNVTQMGSAAVENPDTQYGIYWTQVFARPR